LAAKTSDFSDRKTVHANGRKMLFHPFLTLWPDDGIDPFHGKIPAGRFRRQFQLKVWPGAYEYMGSHLKKS
jgi:hypothetical protein